MQTKNSGCWKYSKLLGFNGPSRPLVVKVMIIKLNKCTTFTHEIKIKDTFLLLRALQILFQMWSGWESLDSRLQYMYAAGVESRCFRKRNPAHSALLHEKIDLSKQ